jgi:hypothetical protein
MVVDKATWEQFSACTNDTRGIRLIDEVEDIGGIISSYVHFFAS